VTPRRRRQVSKPYVGFLFRYYSGPIVNDSTVTSNVSFGPLTALPDPVVVCRVALKCGS
jgi:hypothetical protein